jgi:DNA-repair protein XRCC1
MSHCFPGSFPHPSYFFFFISGPSENIDADSDGDSGLPELPDFFADKHFFLYGEMEASQRRLMTRFITAYAG